MERFKARTRVAGRVRSITKSLGHLVVTMNSGRTRTVTCRFGQESAKDLAAIKPGVIEISECSGGAEPALMRGVVFSDCRMIEVAGIADDYPTLIRRKPGGGFSVRGALSAEGDD